MGTGKASKIKDLAAMMTKIFNLDLEPIFTQSKEGDIINSRADITKPETDLGYLPTHDVSSDETNGLTPVIISVHRAAAGSQLVISMSLWRHHAQVLALPHASSPV